MTARHQVQAIWINRQTCNRFQVGHHRVDQFACIVIVEFDVPVFVSSDADREGGVTDDSVYLAGRTGR